MEKLILGAWIVLIIAGIMSLITTIIGIVLSFSASIILGIITTLFLPCNFVIGLCWWFGINIPNAIQNWINFPI